MILIGWRGKLLSICNLANASITKHLSFNFYTAFRFNYLVADGKQDCALNLSEVDQYD